MSDIQVPVNEAYCYGKSDSRNQHCCDMIYDMIPKYIMNILSLFLAL